jgi:hypothetical protein
MANPRLTKEQREELFAPLLDRVLADLEISSAGDLRVLWAMRRKLAKELMHLERSTPAARTKLKALKWQSQNGLCALCGGAMPQKHSELDRFEAFLGYTESNTRLVHHECHIKDQAKKGYA